MQRGFLRKLSIYHKHRPIIIQFYSQLHKRDHNESGCKLSSKKMPALTAHERKKCIKDNRHIDSKHNPCTERFSVLHSRDMNISKMI